MKNRKIWWGVGVGVGLLLVLALSVYRLPTFSARVMAVDVAPTGYDPLTEQEVEAVLAAALEGEAETHLRAASSSEQEVLLVERHEASKAEYASGSWPRQADVYLYDYATDTLIHRVVAVESGALISEDRLQGVQLPLTANEEQRALTLISEDAALWAELADRYQAVMGEPLHSLDQLQVKVSVLYADGLPDQLNRAAQACGLHRCAQVLIFTTDKTLLEIMPIVDLSQGQVVQVLGGE